jgi:ABC-type multidrug transport system permease subunit
MTTLGAGLFISTISNTQQQALMTFFFMFMPMFLLSGFSFPINSMPTSVQWLTYLNPLRYFMEIIAVSFSAAPDLRSCASNGSAVRFWRRHFQRQRPALPKKLD